MILIQQDHVHNFSDVLQFTMGFVLIRWIICSNIVRNKKTLFTLFTRFKGATTPDTS